MEARLQPLLDQLRYLQSIDSIPVELLLCADYKFLTSFYGHQGASARFPCLLCTAQRPLLPHSAPARTLDSIQLGQFNFKEQPLLPIPFTSIIPPSFHILHGVGQIILDLLERHADKYGHIEEYNAWLKLVHCRRRKRGQNFTGNEVQKLLTHPNPEALCTLIDEPELRDLFLQLMGVLRNIQSCAVQKNLAEHDLDKLGQNTQRFFALWEWLGDRVNQNVTPKVHMLCAHLPTFARQRGWFAAVSEQSIEHLHAIFNRLVMFASLVGGGWGYAHL